MSSEKSASLNQNRTKAGAEISDPHCSHQQQASKLETLAWKAFCHSKNNASNVASVSSAFKKRDPLKIKWVCCEIV